MKTEGLKKIGETLKEKRTQLNLTVRDAENATSIRHTYLVAIEEGEMSKLISPVYAQGFVRQYAIFLGLDGDSIVRENIEIFAHSNHQPEFSYGIGTLEHRGNPGASVRWIPNAAWLAAFLIVLGAAWYVAHLFEVI